jgi:ATP-binding cassette subfamily B protein
MVPRGIISAKRINEILNIKNSIIFPEQSQPISDFSSLKFNDVSFYHENAKEPTLKNISFTLNKNETIAIIGSNGSGKTTIIELIERFYDCTSGNIEINGFDIKTLSKKNLSQLFALVPQKHKLFNDTVKKNISFGSNLVSNEQIEEIKTIASLDFIDKYENKFEYKISQNGKNLSGGQKQRIAIARAISKKTPVILFDDSFSALDFKTDASIRKNMHEKLENKTKIIVASRISTVLNADKIIVLNNGAIEGIGTADELLKNCETYQQIFYSQISSKEVIN